MAIFGIYVKFLAVYIPNQFFVFCSPGDLKECQMIGDKIPWIKIRERFQTKKIMGFSFTQNRRYSLQFMTSSVRKFYASVLQLAPEAMADLSGSKIVMSRVLFGHFWLAKHWTQKIATEVAPLQVNFFRLNCELEQQRVY